MFDIILLKWISANHIGGSRLVLHGLLQADRQNHNHCDLAGPATETIPWTIWIHLCLQWPVLHDMLARRTQSFTLFSQRLQEKFNLPVLAGFVFACHCYCCVLLLLVIEFHGVQLSKPLICLWTCLKYKAWVNLFFSSKLFSLATSVRNQTREWFLRLTFSISAAEFGRGREEESHLLPISSASLL